MSVQRPLSADFVVIGSGICGALVARRLAQQGASVLILEAGPRIVRSQIFDAFIASPRKRDFQSPYPFSPLAPHPDFQPVDNGYLVQAGPDPYKAEYLRVVGGTTWHWSAMAWRMTPNDFHLQSLYGIGVDWPFGYDVLKPFYLEAERIMGVAANRDEHPESPRDEPFPLPPVAEPFAMRVLRETLAPFGYVVVGNTQARNSIAFDGRPPCCGRNNCQPLCPIGAHYDGGAAIESAERAGALLTPNAVVHRLEHDASGRIVAAHYIDATGQKSGLPFRVTGKTFIVAANGIESPKLLLLSKSERYPNGLANSSDMVGRKLMDHPSTSLDFNAAAEVWLGRGPQSPSSINTFRDGDASSPDVRRRTRAAYRLDFTNISRVLGATQTLINKGVYGLEFDRQLRNIAAHQMSVKNVLEILPNPANRVTLSSQTDALGIPKPELHFQFDDYTKAGARESEEHFMNIAQHMGDGRLRTELDAAINRTFANNQHICGTVSMGTAAANSVCDEFGRAWDHENLFMVGTGVLPTSGTSNSTLTAVAVGLRTAQHMLPRA